jgi:16S rRNA (guanine966-N2)-methyltransferase
MRVIAGEARGLRLVAPRDAATRPVADRVKETCFAILADRVVDASVVDLYAGSGALGIEALSRGATSCVFVERGREALAAIRQNLAQTGFTDRAELVGVDVSRFLASAAEPRYDLAFLDPPYAERAILAPLARLLPSLKMGATVAVKHFWRTAVPEPEGLSRWRERRFGETTLTFLERSDPAEEVEMR